MNIKEIKYIDKYYITREDQLSKSITQLIKERYKDDNNNKIEILNIQDDGQANLIVFMLIRK